MPIDDDRIAGIEYALSTLKTREQECIVKYYRDGRTLQDISTDYDIGAKRIFEILSSARRKLRHPTRRHYMLLGFEIASGKVFEEGKRRIEKEIRRADDEARKEYAEEKRIEAMSPVDKVMSKTLEELGFPTKIYTRLRREGLLTVRDIVARKDTLASIYGIGAVSVGEIMRKLKEVKAL